MVSMPAGVTFHPDYILIKNAHGVKLYYPNTVLGPLKRRPRKTATAASEFSKRFNERYSRLMRAKLKASTQALEEMSEPNQNS
jgi:hypothetical protein